MVVAEALLAFIAGEVSAAYSIEPSPEIIRTCEEAAPAFLKLAVM
jgi:hypothetical protein